MAGEDVRVSVGADTGPFAAGMASIKNQVSSVTSSVTSSLTSLVNPASLVTAALTTGVFAVIEYGDKIYDTSQRFHVGTTELQQFSQVAEKNGASLEVVAKAFNKLDVALSQARTGNVEMQKTLERLNILDWADRSQTLAKNMLKIGTSSMESADMVKVLGREGTALRETIIALSNGSEKLAAAMDEKTIKALSDMSDATKELKNQIVVLGGTGVGWLKTFDDWLKRVDESAQKTYQSVKAVAGAFKPGGGGGFTGGAGSDFGPDKVAGNKGVDDKMGSGPPPLDHYLQQNQAILDTLNKEQAVWDLTHSTIDKITTLQNDRVDLERQLDEAITNEGEGSDLVFKIRGQIAENIVSTIGLEQQVSTEKERQAELESDGIAKADVAITQSQQKLQIQALIATGHEAEARLLEIEFDFNNKIKSAIDAANNARSQGLDQTARENDLLSQQLQIEKQKSIEVERQRNAQQASLSAATQMRDAAASLAFYNLRVGATPDTYAQAMAASRGIQPGTPEYESLVQKIRAEDQLRLLQGKTLGWADQLGRDKLVQWFSDKQAAQGITAANQSQADQIAYWKAIAAGQTPPQGNPFVNLYGSGASTGSTQPIPNAPSPSIILDQTQVALLRDQLALLQSINKNLTPRPGGT